MPTGKSKIVSKLSAWRPLQIQVVVFPAKPAIDLDQHWYKEITGQDPQEKIRRPNERIEKGQFQDADLVLSADLLKAGLVWGPRTGQIPDPKAVLEERLPTLGQFDVAQTTFAPLVLKWLSRLDVSVKRIGFNGKVIQPVKDHAAGYQSVARFTHSIKLDPTSSDFLFRINRRRPSGLGIKGLEINRLCTWSVLRGIVQAQGQLPTGEVIIGNTAQFEVFACSLDFDINTAPEFKGELPKKKLPAIFQELVKLINEIAERGDIP